MRFASGLLVLGACSLLAVRGAAAQSFATTFSPAPPSTASGYGTLTLGSDKMLSFSITIVGLHGAETSVHVHGPAAPGSDAGVLFTLPLGNSISGELGPLSPAQEADLGAGLWYVNVHSSHHPYGELRGQIRIVAAVDTRTWGAVKALYAAR